MCMCSTLLKMRLHSQRQPRLEHLCLKVESAPRRKLSAHELAHFARGDVKQFRQRFCSVAIADQGRLHIVDVLGKHIVNHLPAHGPAANMKRCIERQRQVKGSCR